MKPGQIALSTLLAIATGSMTVRAASITLSKPGVATQGTQANVEVRIALDPGENLYAYQLSLIFSPLLLEATSVTPLGYFAANSIGASSFVDNAKGSVSIFDSLSGTDSLTFSDSLVRITFGAVAPGLANLNLDPTSLILLDRDFADLRLASLRATNNIVIGPEQAVPEPAAIILVLGGFAAMVVARLRRRRQFLLKPAPRE